MSPKVAKNRDRQVEWVVAQEIIDALMAHPEPSRERIIRTVMAFFAGDLPERLRRGTDSVDQ